MERRPGQERRRYVRYPLATSVRFYHGPSRREYPARSVDISGGGILMYVPAGAPIAPGHTIRLTVGGANRPEFAPLDRDAPVEATIVRVDRHRMLSTGHLPVGIRFQQAQA